MRGLVIFPRMVLHFDVGREKSIKALKEAAKNDKRIFLTAQRDPYRENQDNMTLDDIYELGVIAEVRQILKTPDNVTRVLVEGVGRACANELVSSEPHFTARVAEIKEPECTLDSSEQQALCRMLSAKFREYCQYAPKMPDSLYDSIVSEKDVVKMSDIITFNVFMKLEDRQEILETLDIEARVKLIITILANEIDVMRLELNIQDEVKEAVDRNQREYYLREQLKVISRQLGNGSDDPTEEGYEYLDRIEEIGFSEDVTEKLTREVERMMKQSSTSQEYAVVKSYLDSILEMPWNVYTTDSDSIPDAEKQLDKDHYGLKKVKERILETLSVRVLNPELKGQIICLVGPPGVGKTSIGRSISEALGRKYARISLGGVHDEAEIRGHRKTYIGAMPGRIINAIKQAKSMNPVIVLDEIDKMGSDYKGDPASAMLEVLDPEQNVSFTDHYFEIPVDLSDVLFITTANTTDTIPAPLLDRMEIIELGSYTREEKFNIAKKHLLPKQLKKHGETKSTVSINDKALYAVIDGYTKEAGVRRLEKNIAAVCRKAAKRLVEGEAKVNVTAANISDFLGVMKYLPDDASKRDEVGVVNGLAWTSAGGVLMPLEVLVMDGTGKTEVTGSLGDVMKESSKIAVSLVRSLADEYSIDKEFYKNKDLHIHAPEGAVPKDGPSAGVTMTTALVSALSGMPVKAGVAMTGEITLHGKVLAIGGLREKAMAAYKAGIKTVIIPKENYADISEIDEVVRNNISFVTAENIRTVLDTALVKPVEHKSKRTVKKPAADAAVKKTRRQTRTAIN